MSGKTMVTNKTIRFLLTVHERGPLHRGERVFWCIDMNEEEAEANIKLGLITKSVRLDDTRYCCYTVTETGNDYVAHIKELLDV